MQETEWILKKVPESVRPGSGCDRDLPFILRILLAQRGILPIVEVPYA